MKKKIIIVLISILVVILILIGLYFYGLTSVSKNSELVSFNVSSGNGIKKVINDLYEAKIIKSKISANIYILMHRDLIVQAGNYELNRNFDIKEIFRRLNSGELYDSEVRITFIEGRRLTEYMTKIEEIFGISEEEILAVLNDKEYLQYLIEKYEFIGEEILNEELYYSLEGYMFPATYTFGKRATIKEIIEKTLDKTKEVLDNYSALISSSSFTTHEILTMASIIENETMRSEDRAVASQVIHKRLDVNMNLGMDVTTYYGAKKALGEPLTQVDLNEKNAYNTRNTSFKGLPVGPISSPSEASIKAALEPSDTNYLYFYADTSGKLHFAESYEEFLKLVEEYRW